MISRPDHPEFKVGPKSNARCPYKRSRGRCETDQQSSVETGAESVALSKELLGPPKAGRLKEGFSPQTP